MTNLIKSFLIANAVLLSGCELHKAAVDTSVTLYEETGKAAELSKALGENHVATYKTIDVAYKAAQSARVAQRRVIVLQLREIEGACEQRLARAYADAQNELRSERARRFDALIGEVDELLEPLRETATRNEGAFLRARDEFKARPHDVDRERAYTETGDAFIKAGLVYLDMRQPLFDANKRFGEIEVAGLKSLEDEYKTATGADGAGAGRCRTLREQYESQVDSRAPLLADRNLSTPDPITLGYDALPKYFTSVQRSAESLRDTFNIGENVLKDVKGEVTDTLINKVKNVAQPVLGAVSTAIETIPTQLSDAAKDFVDQQTASLKNLVEGAAQRLEESANATKDDVTRKVNDALSGTGNANEGSDQQ